MPSPFPGMNPYLEQDDAWHDFHESFMPVVREILTAQVKPRYIVKIDEHLYVHEVPAEDRYFLGRADVAVTPAPSPGASHASTSVLEAPAQVLLPPTEDIEHHSFLEIRDRHNRQLITVLELLSPSNKRPGPDRDQFQAKRYQVLSSAANYVEIDLLRGAPRLPLINLPPCDYYALVSRVEERPRAGVWALQLADRLPTIPVPLRTGEPAATLDLQEVLNRIYDGAGYEVYIYAGAPEPPLSSEAEVWARQFVPRKS